MQGLIRLLLAVALVAPSACTKREPTSPAIPYVPPEPGSKVGPGPEKKAAGTPTTPRAAPAAPAVAVGDRKILVRDCLLRLPQAKRVGSTALPRDRDRLAALTDNDAATAAVLPATRDLPLDVVYHFGGAEVSPHELVVLLPESAPADARTARVEVLTSLVSAGSGFQLVRADPLEATGRVQRFRLRPQSANWVIVRFIPGVRTERVAVAEVALLGRVGPPESPYAFKESPARAIDLLDKLKGLAGVSVALSPEEADLVADVKDGRFRKWSFADAALLVSGVGDPAKRKEYGAKIDALAAEAKSALTGTDGVESKGEGLLRWLHAKALAGGYVAGQTDLPPVLDRNQFNCVSSAVLYNVLAKRLGLDARGIQVPDHAFSVVYDGTRHFDVETTTDRGFNPLRDKAAVAEFESRTGFTYVPDTDRDQRREVTDAGMLAMVYFNHGVDHFQAGKFPAALAAFFRALSLDRDLASATKNALLTLAAWGVTEGAAGRFAEAQAILRTGLVLAPKDARLQSARVHIWAGHAEREFARGGLEAGLAALRAAAVEAPDGPFAQLQAWLVVRPGEALLAAKKWEDAAALVEPFLTRVDPPAREELLRWRGGVFLLWANEEIAAGRFEKALEVVERGLKMHPKDGRFPDLLTAVSRNWVQTSYAEKGPEAAREVVKALGVKGEQNPVLRESARRAPYWLVIELQGQAKPEEVEVALSASGPLVKGEVDDKQILRDVYDHWAGALLDKGDYRGAFGVYVRALDRLPDDPILRAHLAYVVHRWLGAVEKAGGPERVKALIAELRDGHPTLKDLVGLTPAAAWTSIRGLRDAGRYAEAVEALDRFGDLLTKADEVREMYRHLYDRWADDYLQKKDPARAVDIYELADRKFPKDKHVWNNLAATIQDWAIGLQADGREGEAKAVLLRALVRFPAVPDVAEVARNHVPLLVQGLRKEGTYAEALAVLDRHLDLLQELHGAKAAAERERIGRQVYHAWAGRHRERKEWDKALEVYEKGIRHLPNEKELVSGAAGVYDAWAKTFFDPKDWDGAITIYDKGLKRFPDSSLLKDNRKYCETMKQRPGK
jgi:tetratricopeptide (TPR) repeat protein